MKYRTKRPQMPCRPTQQNDNVRQDNRSIDTAMGVAATDECRATPLHQESVSGAFVIQRDREDGRRMDDDISVLTECSFMDEDEDTSSQVTAAAASETWTVVTTATDSTTIPTRNTARLRAHRNKRRNAVVTENPFAHDNSPFKRRRKR